MLKNKTTVAIAGVMALVGMIGGTALMASAQTAPTTANTPAVTTTTTNTSAQASSAVDTPENANDPADTNAGAAVTSISSPRHAQVEGKSEANDTDGGPVNETSEGSSPSVALDQ